MTKKTIIISVIVILGVFVLAIRIFRVGPINEVYSDNVGLGYVYMFEETPKSYRVWHVTAINAEDVTKDTVNYIVEYYESKKIIANPNDIQELLQYKMWDVFDKERKDSISTKEIESLKNEGRIKYQYDCLYRFKGMKWHNK